MTTALYRANKSWVFKITTKGKGISGSQSGGGPPLRDMKLLLEVVEMQMIFTMNHFVQMEFRGD